MAVRKIPDKKVFPGRQLTSEMQRDLSPSNGYRVVLTITEDGYKYNGMSFEFDTVDNKDLSKGVDITTHPLVSGDLVGDHSYKQNLTLNLSGKFSLVGNQPTPYKGEKDRLANIEKFYEELMDNGVRVNIKTMKRGDNTLTRFQERNNMVINNVRWTEGQVDLGFSMSFMQIMFANIQEEPSVVENVQALLALTDAVPVNFAEEVFDDSQLAAMIIEILKENNLFEDGFLQHLTGPNLTRLITGLSVAAVGAGVLSVGLFSLAGTLGISGGVVLVSNPVGWIIAGVGAIGVGLYFAIKEIVRACKKVGNVLIFKYYANNEKKNDKERERFVLLLAYLVGEIKNAMSYIKMLDVPSNQNQEMMTYIGDNYYIFEFNKISSTASGKNLGVKPDLLRESFGIEKEISQRDMLDGVVPINEHLRDKFEPIMVLDREDYDAGYYSLEVKDIEGNVVASRKKVIAETNFEAVQYSPLFVTKDGRYVYLMNTEVQKIIETYSKDKYPYDSLDTLINVSQKNIDGLKIIVSQFDLKEFSERITNIINNCLVNYDEKALKNQLKPASLGE